MTENRTLSKDSLACFKRWLIQEKHLQPKSAKDIVSRIKRANSIKEIPAEDFDKYLFELSRCEQFKGMGVSVRSQIRGAVKKWSEYTEGIKLKT